MVSQGAILAFGAVVRPQRANTVAFRPEAIGLSAEGVWRISSGDCEEGGVRRSLPQPESTHCMDQSLPGQRIVILRTRTGDGALFLSHRVGRRHCFLSLIYLNKYLNK